MVTRFCQTEVQISDAGNNLLFDTLVGTCSCQCPCRCHLTPSVNEITYCILKRICKNILKELLHEQRKETYSIFDGGKMKYDRIDRYESPRIYDGKDWPLSTKLPSNQRCLSVNFMQKISKHQRAQQTAKSSYGQEDSTSVDRKTHRAEKVMKKNINKGGSEGSNEKLIVIPNVRQQVREGNAKLSSEHKTRKSLQRMPLKMAKESRYVYQADDDSVEYQKNAKGNAANKDDESGKKFQKDKARNDGGRSGKDKTDRGYSGQGRLEKDKSSLEVQISEGKRRKNTPVSAKIAPRADKVAENKFPKVDTIVEKSVGSKDHFKQTPSGKDNVSLAQVSAIEKRNKNEINDKIQNQGLGPSNKALSGQTAGKPDSRSRRLPNQTQGKPSQGILTGNGQYKKGPHVPKSQIGQANYLNKRSHDLGQNYPQRKRRQSVDRVSESRNKFDHPPRNCRKPKPTILSRADAIRPCDYLRALMEDREMCFPKYCAPCPPCRPSTPCNPYQAPIVQCSC